MTDTMTMPGPDMTRPPLTNAQKDIIERTADYLVEASRVPGQRMLIHGWDAEGDMDIEFPNAWMAMSWATEYNAQAVVDVRDAGKPGTIKSLTDTCVLTFNLYDYAKAQLRRGRAIPGTDLLFV